ncbi:MAG: CHRD domain-containing protein [Aurantibacter sp.]
MKTFKNFLFKFGLVSFLLLGSCSSDDNGAAPANPDMDNVDPDNPDSDNPDPDNPDPNNPRPTGMSKTYTLGSVSNPDISGTAEFIALDNGSIDVEIELQNTEAGEMHPGHIHLNTAVEGGPITISLNDVDGATGMGTTNVTALDDGTSISYEALLDFDGYINIHLNENDLETLIAQGDIGQNELTGVSKTYQMDGPNRSGTVSFAERANGEILTSVELLDFDSRIYGADIFLNSVLESGDKAISLSAIDSITGISKTNIARLDNGVAIDYVGILEFDGHIAISSAGFVAVADIGQNELTGESKEYELPLVNTVGIGGTATFAERKSGETLVTIELQNTMVSQEYEGAIYLNSAIEDSPEKAISLNIVNGEDGIEQTHLSKQDDGSAISYDDLLNFDGHIEYKVKISDFVSLEIVRGDIGQNELTGKTKPYDFVNGSNTFPDISGTATFNERKSSETLIIVELQNTEFNLEYGTAIFLNSIEEEGGKAISLNPFMGIGTIRIGQTHIAMLDDGTAVSYDDLLNFDGHMNFHEVTNLGNIVIGRADIGQNELTGESKTYFLDERDFLGVNATATFFERVSGKALAVIEVVNSPGPFQPSHIHMNDLATGGPKVFSFSSFYSSGISKTHFAELDDGTPFGYTDVLTYDGYIDIHLNESELNTLVAEGNIGSNE